MRSSATAGAKAVILLLVVTGLLAGALVEFYNVAWGTGTWIGQFSLKWAVAFSLFALLCLVCLLGIGWAVRSPRSALRIADGLAGLRQRLGVARWILAAIAVLLPIVFLQYSPWGVVIRGPYLRVLIWCLAGLFVGYLINADMAEPGYGWGFLAGLLLSGASFAIAAALTNVTNYPFSLGWSEGNRLWDYSLLFGKRLYSYSATDVPAAYLDIGRQLAGGLPFLLPHVSILGERLWLAALGVLPYVLLGLLAFWPERRTDVPASVLAGIWSFMFLGQGPIHAPLLFCAALVAIARRLPAWPAAALLLISGYCAEVSRFTWMFAPALWAGMLEIAGATTIGTRIPGASWRRAVLIALAGLTGAALGIVRGIEPAGGTSLGAATAASTSQALLWYRLFPNATYGDGILLGLAIAAGPLLVWLTLLRGIPWKSNRLQSLAVALPIAAFLIVGLVVSTKIGGGGDLHNMDMFLIGLVFAAALAWRALGVEGMASLWRSSFWVRVVVVLLVAVPAFQPLMTLRPLSFGHDADWLSVLTDVERPRDLGSLPVDDVVHSSLEQLAASVQQADARGDVLFMDQRQLLTFGNIRNVRLVGAYEKKLLMDQALSGNRSYFEAFYRDLAAQRFALIISSPLRTPIKDSEYGFGEENNAWVQWVARPILCYYEEQDTLNEVKVEMLVPRAAPTGCDTALP